MRTAEQIEYEIDKLKIELSKTYDVQDKELREVIKKYKHLRSNIVQYLYNVDEIDILKRTYYIIFYTKKHEYSAMGFDTKEQLIDTIAMILGDESDWMIDSVWEGSKEYTYEVSIELKELE